MFEVAKSDRNLRGNQRREAQVTFRHFVDWGASVRRKRPIRIRQLTGLVGRSGKSSLRISYVLFHYGVLSKLLTWFKRRFEARQTYFAEMDYRAACDRAAKREEHWNP
jgi:hypothetical protein